MIINSINKKIKIISMSKFIALILSLNFSMMSNYKLFEDVVVELQFL